LSPLSWLSWAAVVVLGGGGAAAWEVEAGAGVEVGLGLAGVAVTGIVLPGMLPEGVGGT